MATTLASQVQELYIGYLGRAADKAGLDFWVKAVETGVSTLESVALGFTLSEEYKAQYDGLTTTQLVARVYQNVLGRTADAEGLAFWVGEINKGVIKADALVKSMIGSLSAVDQLNIDNKVQAANTYTTTAGDKYDLAAAKAAIGASTSNNPGQTFTLTNSTDNIAGTTGNDTFIGDNVSTSAGDTIVGGAGEDTLKLFGTATSPNYSGIEHVYLNAPGGNFDVSGKADVKSIELDSEAGSRTLTVTTGQTVKLSNETTAGQTTTIAGNTPTSLDVVVNKFGTTANQQTLALTGTSVNTLNLSSATAASNLLLTNAGGKLATVNFTGDQAVTVDTALTTITTINAANATGGLNVNSIGASSLTFTGGKGNDRINLGTTLTAADKVDGGDGTDTLAINNSTATFTKANLVNVKGFEVLEATGAAAGTYDVDNLIANNALTGIKVSATTSATVNNINAGAVGNIVVSASNTGGLTFTAKDFVAGGTSDTAGITLDNSVTKSVTGIDVGTGLSFANVDVLNLKTVSDGTAAKTVASGNGHSIAALSAPDLEKIVITGDETLTLATAAATVGLTEVDASGLTGKAALSLNTSAAANISLLVKATANADTINLSNTATKTVTLYTGGGSDNIALDGGATANQTLKFTSTALNAGDVKAGDAIAITLSGGAAGGQVHLDFGTAIEALLKNGGTVLGTAAANVGIQGTALGVTTNVASSVAVAGGADVTTFQIDLNGDGVYNAADDFQVQITVTGVAGADDTLVYNAATKMFDFTIA